MRKLRGLPVMAVACILGLSLMGFGTSQATPVKSSSAVAVDASTELALLNAGELEVVSVTCTKCVTDNMPCPQSNCGGASSPNCCCKWCNGAFECVPKTFPGHCYAE